MTAMPSVSTRISRPPPDFQQNRRPKRRIQSYRATKCVFSQILERVVTVPDAVGNDKTAEHKEHVYAQVSVAEESIEPRGKPSPNGITKYELHMEEDHHHRRYTTKSVDEQEAVWGGITGY